MPAEMQGQSLAVVTENALKQLIDIQSMIDIMSERLVALRDLRLQEFIKQEIRSLEGKLIKHFWKQLTTKCKVPKDHRTEIFKTYPSLSQWLVVVGVNNSVNEKLSAQGFSVEVLLELNDEEICKVLTENDGDSEDKRKLLSALQQLKDFNERNVNNQQDTEGIFWDSWCKATQSKIPNGVESPGNSDHVKSEVDYNENIQRVDSNLSKSGDFNNELNEMVNDKHEILVHTTSGRTTTPASTDKPDGRFSNTGHQLSPPSPPHSSKSSLSSSGPPSPPAHLSKMYAVPSGGEGVQPQSANAHMAYYLQNYPQGQGAVAARIGQSTKTSTPPPNRSSKMQEPNPPNSHINKTGNSNLLLPFGPMRTARSYEWQVGNRITAVGEDNMTNSTLSLTSITTLPPPSSSSSSGSKLFSAGKKRKKRPGNINIHGNDKRDPFLTMDPPDLIDLLRPANRKPSQSVQTISPESGPSTCNSGSPMSPRTPMTPSTPFNNDMWLQHRDFSSPVPQTPKTPSRFKGGLRAIKDKIRGKISRAHKLKRIKSEERVTDEPVPAPSRHKIRSETFPLINVSGISTSNPGGNEQSAALRYQADDSHHNSTHSSSSSISESSHQLLRMHHDSSSFDAGLLSSGMTTPGEASMLSGRDNFGFDMNSYFESASNFSGTEKTLVAEESEVDSVDQSYSRETSQDFGSEDDIADELEDTLDGDLQHTLRATLMRQASTTSTMTEEWDIPWDEIVFQDIIGRGRVGTVYKGRWHGEVAIRVIDICHNDDSKLRAFKAEVMLYKKTRHDNVELFMGSCMNPPQLAIVTGFCRGKSLYHHIRSNKEQQVNLNQAKIIAQHIALGMGYLHSRGIIHKDLKSKNIFVDGKRVVVTDFGLMGLHAISSRTLRVKPKTLQIPDGWLCYMAPEVIRALGVPEEGIDVVSCLPYTKASDVYAFGTVWYELLTGCWPFKEYPAEFIIWQVGNGKKQSLAHLQGPKELKDILMTCWSYDALQRPDFSDAGIMGHLLRLPQAKIFRRSSQPIKGTKKGGRLGGVGGHDRLFDPFSSVLHELAE